MLRHASVHVSVLLEGECGFDEVLALRFQYNAELVALLKEALWAVRRGRRSAVGGWSPRERCWRVEGKAWPEVRRSLLGAGVELDGLEELIRPEPEPKPKKEGFFF